MNTIMEIQTVLSQNLIFSGKLIVLIMLVLVDF